MLGVFLEAMCTEEVPKKGDQVNVRCVREAMFAERVSKNGD